MSVCEAPPQTGRAPTPPLHIEIIEADPADCPFINLPPEGNVKLRNYRTLSENVRAYTLTGDIHTSPVKGKLVARFDVSSSISPPRARILELLRPEDPGRDALEAIVRPAPRRGLARPLDDDARRFLQRALLSPSPHLHTPGATPEPRPARSPEPRPPRTPEPPAETPEPDQRTEPSPPPRAPDPSRQMSLADELREAEEDERSGGNVRRDIFLELRRRGGLEEVERERMGKLALSVEEDEAGCGSEGGLAGAARRLDALLLESRALHGELAAIHRDIQTECARAGRCAAGARALVAEWRAVKYLDDVVALLKGDVRSARRAREWPFAIGRRQPGRNYVV